MSQRSLDMLDIYFRVCGRHLSDVGLSVVDGHAVLHGCNHESGAASLGQITATGTSSMSAGYQTLAYQALEYTHKYIHITLANKTGEQGRHNSPHRKVWEPKSCMKWGSLYSPPAILPSLRRCLMLSPECPNLRKACTCVKIVSAR
jgi:hypothetical protein